MSDSQNQSSDVVSRLLGISKDELKRLANEGVVIKAGNDKYNLLQSIRGYINHMQSKDTRAPTQREVAEHLDMSERNARDVLKVLNIDWTQSTLDSIRTAYIRDLREKAAGRGGDDQASLTKARTRDAEMGADLKQLQIMEKAGQLVPVAEIEPQIIAMVTAARTELLGMPNKLANEMKALHGIDIDESLIEEHIYEVLQHLANGLHENAADDDGAGVQDLGTTA